MGRKRSNISPEEWEFLESVGELFRDLREEFGLTQREAARAIESTQARISDIENGKSDILVGTLNRWASAYGYRIEIGLVPMEDEFDAALNAAIQELQEEESDGD